MLCSTILMALFVTEDYGKPQKTRFINFGRNLSCCTEEDKTTDCRKETPQRGSSVR